MQQIVIYHPDYIENNGLFMQSVSVEAYVFNRNTNQWYLSMYQTPCSN